MVKLSQLIISKDYDRWGKYMKLSVLIPFYNEEEQAALTLATVDQIDDGKKDAAQIANTTSVQAQIADGGEHTVGTDSAQENETEADGRHTREVSTESDAMTEDTQEVLSGSVISPTVQFTEDSSLSWPAAGSILMDYSMDGTVYFNFPADRMYMAPEQLKKLSVVELSERVQVPEDNGKTKTAMKNEITALVRVKDGRAAISRVLANGGPVEQIFTTVGKNLSVKYATSKDEKDQYNEKRFFTAADMDKNGKESDN